jgi:hypothetical protein
MLINLDFSLLLFIYFEVFHRGVDTINIDVPIALIYELVN